MTDHVKDLVSYLSGDPGDARDRCRRSLADPASDLSHFLTAARERTRAAIAEPAFRGLGLSPAACLPADPDGLTAEAEDKRNRRWLPWLVAILALLLAGLSAWAPWRHGAAPVAGDPAPGPVAARPAAGDDRLDRPGQFPRGEARFGPVEIPGNGKLGPAAPEAPAVAVKPGGLPTPPVPDEAPTGPKPPVKVPDMVPAQPALPFQPGEDRKVIAAQDKKLKAAEAQIKALERDNDDLKQAAIKLQAQVNKLAQDALETARAHADCLARAALQQKTIDALQARIEALKPVADENQKLRDYVKKLESALKVQPPTDPVKPKVGPQEPKKKP